MGKIPASTLKKLRGRPHDLGSHELEFAGDIPGWKIPMQTGGEGFATPIRLRAKGGPWNSPIVLKVFHHECVERRQRSEFLCALGLSNLELPSNAFEAAPTLPFYRVFHDDEHGAIPMEGYLAPLISGETFGDLLGAMSWDPALSARLSLARQLCMAVEVLEGGGLVHGDLAPNNLMIVGYDSPRPELRLIDFDGFFHPEVPLVPIMAGRTWGTEGYRARKFKFGAAQAVTTSDRLAMAVLVMEIITRHHADDLESGLFIRQEAIDQGELDLDPAIGARWPAGWELLRRAVVTEDPANAPSPRSWRAMVDALAALGGCAGASPAAPPNPHVQPDPASPAAVPSGPMSLSRRLAVRLRRDNQEPRWIQLRQPNGSFELVAPELGWLSYVIESNTMLLTGTTPRRPDRDDRYDPLYVRHGGEDADAVRYAGDISVRAALGSVLIWRDINIALG